MTNTFPALDLKAPEQPDLMAKYASLVGIQNGLEPHRVLRLRLDPEKGRIVEGTILERANPAFDEPTLGVVVGRDFFYVANSQYEAFGEDGRPDPRRLKETVILELRLDWLGGS